MRIVTLILLILTTTLAVSQTKHSDINVNVEVDGIYNKIIVSIKTESDPLDNCKMQIIDSKKNIVKTKDMPKNSKNTQSIISTSDLLPGYYVFLISKGNDELYKNEFFKDAVDTEPASAINPKNK